MASNDNKLLLQHIQKLGLASHESLAPKSTELHRLLLIRSSGALTGNLSESAKATLCIDLAASLLGLPFDTETALKLSGLKKPAYSGGRRMVEKVLDITRTVGIGEICVQLGLNQVQKEATGLLEAYKRHADTGTGSDFTHPQYAAMAVYQACQRRKVKPPKTKLVALSHLKPTQWTMLEKNWEKCLANAPVANSAQDDNKEPAMQIEEETRGQTDSKHASRKHGSPEKVETYQNWKKRMLEKAYRELELLRGSG
ncbi:origin recognition complex subunit 6 [Anopheles cruzii]|uniref:origin recognition complex subunit 6 n=1 Tax=Anopheles cruzii TaxID=68878 RepID=UPI0022EC7D44|nr:origin recognition complex subunit 6 [Anopheles cruzii]